MAISSSGIDGSDYEDLYNFHGGTDGGLPQGDLTLSGGTLFGMAGWGGANGDGTAFAFALPMPTPEPGTLAVRCAPPRLRLQRIAGGERGRGGKSRRHSAHVTDSLLPQSRSVQYSDGANSLAGASAMALIIHTFGLGYGT